MKPVSLSTLKKELEHCSENELLELCIKLAKFKVENKELLSYLLFDSNDEQAYIDSIKEEIDATFLKVNQDNLFYVKKSTRKILRLIKKYIRYSKSKETEATLLIHFCANWNQLNPAHKRSKQMIIMYDQQVKMAIKAISFLHEDLQYDFRQEIDSLTEK